MTIADVSRVRLAGAFLVASSILGVAGVGRADVAAAEALFREAKQKMAAGDIPGACQKFAESQRQDPSPGTALNLADCHEKQGRVASAWAEFLAAARTARNSGDPARADEATRRAKNLEGGLSNVTVRVTEIVPGLEIRRDDDLLEQGALGSKLPTDPGPHVFQAKAPGYKPWAQTIVVKPNGDLQEVTVPALTRDPNAGAVAPPGSASGAGPAAPPPEVPERKSLVPGAVIGGAGVVVAGVGAIFGASALSTYNDAEKACPTHTNCTHDAKSKADSAGTKANVANVAIPVGVVGIGVGVFLLVRAIKANNAADAQTTGSSFVFTPTAGPGFGGGALQGSF